MKCAMCGKGNLKEKMVDYKEFGVSLGKYKADVCAKCGEVFFDSETARKIQAKSRELGLFGLTKKTKVAKVGNSLAIRIPKEIAEYLHLKEGTETWIQPEGDKLVIEKG